jgi:hypothetical protein
MKILLTIAGVFILFLLPAQTINQVIYKGIYYNVINNPLNIDTINPNRLHIPDGRYFIFYKNNTNPEHDFNIHNGLVDGYYRHYNYSGSLDISGKYYMDSTFSFLKLSTSTSNSDFKVGTWCYKSLLSTKLVVYNKVFDSINIYRDVILNENGEIILWRKWNRDVGLIEEKRYKDGKCIQDLILKNDSLIYSTFYVNDYLYKEIWYSPSRLKIFYHKNMDNYEQFTLKIIENTEYLYSFLRKKQIKIEDNMDTLDLDLIQITEFDSFGNIKTQKSYFEKSNNSIELNFNPEGFVISIYIYKGKKMIKKCTCK